MTLPRISIVTPCLNRAQYLGEAIESVRAQNYANCEHIIVDGLSTDGTVELLARYPHLRVIREADNGLYDALNKGLRAATGEIIGHLNSDDLFAPDVFRRVQEAASDPAIEAVYGHAEIFCESQVDAGSARLAEAQRLSAQSVALTFETVTLGAPNPNARFFRRSVYERAGYCDTRYRVAADRDFLLRVALLRPRAALLDGVIYRYRWHAGALTFASNPAGDAQVRDEYLDIAERFLVRTDLPAEARPPLRRWHRRESATAATRLLFAGELRRCGRYAARGVQVSATWPIHFARHVGGALLGR